MKSKNLNKFLAFSLNTVMLYQVGVFQPLSAVNLKKAGQVFTSTVVPAALLTLVGVVDAVFNRNQQKNNPKLAITDAEKNSDNDNTEIKSNEIYAFKHDIEDILKGKYIMKQNMELEKIKALCEKSIDIFKTEQNVLEIEEEGEVIFVGDLHGNVEETIFCINFFLDKIINDESSCTIVFLGDYVDRGKNSLAVVNLVLRLKLLYPEKVFVLRGNHEDRNYNYFRSYQDISDLNGSTFLSECLDIYGGNQDECSLISYIMGNLINVQNYQNLMNYFTGEVKVTKFKYNDKCVDCAGYEIWDLYNQVFEYLPFAAVVNRNSNKIFAAHAGIPTSDGFRIYDLNNLKKPVREPQKTCELNDLIWSDPSDDSECNVEPNKLRGKEYRCFGENVYKKFMHNNNLNVGIFGHRKIDYGFYKPQFNSKLVTVFSASNYENNNNTAGILVFDIKSAGCRPVGIDGLGIIKNNDRISVK
ncbi:MAG: Ser/Thr-protein phosphatase [Candidatus Paraimprobicoccus trichonymphae]|uniref:Ser/Thr-protein phosphatase n=1 Tax=Candidatus Paraimprobicoccus trichonymphae TaxID=3033793 RepID=A0AA48L1B0_9FIRM|nr:MAG: Ser/Thr-protein phosphatase [Candidatus Paraimprobicoccus trichonymphae]